MKFEHSSRLLAILDDDKSGQSALQDLVEARGISALYFSSNCYSPQPTAASSLGSGREAVQLDAINLTTCPSAIATLWHLSLYLTKERGKESKSWPIKV